MKAIGYIRVSSEKQGDGDGPDRQRAEIERHCAANAIELARMFEDIGVSGASMDRPALAEALEYAKANGVGLLLVENADRWARELLVGETLLMAWRESGIRVYSIQGGIDMTENDDASAKMIRQIVAAVAENVKNSLVKRMRSGRERVKRVKGKCEGRKRMERTNASAALVKLRSEGASWAGIAKVLNSRGYKTLRGRPWTFSNVRREYESLKKYQAEKAAKQEQEVTK